jgi:hypothetical protein
VNDRPKQIAHAMRALVAALPGSKGFALDTYEGHTALRIDAVTDDDVRTLSDAFGLTVEYVDLPSGTCGAAWWMRGKGHGDKLHVSVEGPHHAGRRLAVDEAGLAAAVDGIAALGVQS